MIATVGIMSSTSMARRFINVALTFINERANEDASEHSGSGSHRTLMMNRLRSRWFHPVARCVHQAVACVRVSRCAHVHLASSIIHVHHSWEKMIHVLHGAGGVRPNLAQRQCTRIGSDSTQISAIRVCITYKPRDGHEHGGTT